jgi:signal transduction histidine kinase
VTSLTVELSSQLKEKLDRLTQENEALRRQLRHAQSLATVGTVTGMIVHEFNNILTPIINYAHLAASGDAEMVNKAITRAAEGGQRAVDICKALLGLLHEDAAEPVRLPLAELVQQSLLATGRNLAKDGITLTVRVADDLCVTARPSELKQVLVNLLLNARAAVRTKGMGGSVTITGSREAGGVRISVEDSGIGIAPELMELIWEPLFTTKTGQDGQERGSGLGLPLCREIVGSMGGKISVESVQGQGATFHVWLAE